MIGKSKAEVMDTGSTTRRRLIAVAGAIACAAPLLAAPMPVLAAGAQTYLFLVFSDPVAGREADYDRWFAGRHLDRMAAVPGVMSLQHLVDARLELRHGAVKTPHDLVIYTVVTGRPEAFAQAIARLKATGDAWPGPEVATVSTATYRAFGPPIAGVGGEPAGAKLGATASYDVLALHNVVEGQDAAFNDWYDKIHLPELLADPGLASGQRGMQSPVQFGPSDNAPRYVVVLRIVTRDLPAVFTGMLHGGPPSPAIDRAHSYGFTYKAVG